jgi:ubiquinone/menaquinone biosynthesis C-methylase UbiE
MAEEVEHTTMDFTRQYLLLRKKEERIYTDTEVAALPDIYPGHKHYNEWQVRKSSSDRLVQYLMKKQRPLEILEVGSGNGWLSAKLAGIPMSHVTGIDMNAEELDQSRRVFAEFENLKFFNSSLTEMIWDRQFDVIVFAASIQYFSSLTNTVNDSLKQLGPGGEIHIVDTHFYNRNKIDPARFRTNEYYRSIGFPEMTEHYFHHSLEDLALFNYEILHDPGSIRNMLKKTKNPFYWICIRNNA